MSSSIRNDAPSLRATTDQPAPRYAPGELAAAPFLPGGVGDQLSRAAYAYLEEYELSGEGADHTPTDFERFLIEDFMNGLLCDEHLFGPVRRLLLALAPFADYAHVQGRRLNPSTLYVGVKCSEGEFNILGEHMLAALDALSPRVAGEQTPPEERKDGATPPNPSPPLSVTETSQDCRAVRTNPHGGAEGGGDE
jgi:hypothetical protein